MDSAMSPSVTGEAHPPQTELSCAGHAGILSVTKPRLRWGCSTAESWCFSDTGSSRPGETVPRLQAVLSTLFNASPLYSMAGFIDTGSGCKACRGGCSRCTGRCRNCIGMLTIVHSARSAAPACRAGCGGMPGRCCAGAMSTLKPFCRASMRVCW